MGNYEAQSLINLSRACSNRMRMCYTTRVHVRRCSILRLFLGTDRALKLGERDVNLGLYIGIHDKRQDIIYSDYL